MAALLLHGIFNAEVIECAEICAVKIFSAEGPMEVALNYTLQRRCGFPCRRQRPAKLGRSMLRPLRGSFQFESPSGEEWDRIGSICLDRFT